MNNLSNYELKESLRSGAPSSSHEKLAMLRILDDPVIDMDLLKLYIENAEILDLNSLLSDRLLNRDVEIFNSIIDKLSFRRVKSKAFIDIVIRTACGAQIYNDDYTIATAIYALPRIVEIDDEIRSILRCAVRERSEPAIEAALVSAQRYMGVPELSIKWGFGSVPILSVIDKSVVEFLNP